MTLRVFGLLKKLDARRRQEGVCGEGSGVSSGTALADTGGDWLSGGGPAARAIPHKFEVRWASERGWVELRDPVTSEWHAICAREAPRWVVKAAMRSKHLGTRRLSQNMDA